MLISLMDTKITQLLGIAVDATFDDRIKNDLIKAEAVSGPLSLIILLLVFGSVVAAFLPVGVGLFTVISALGVTIWLSTQIEVTNYATNIISLIGIGVSIDYSLFLVNRFREEIARGRDQNCYSNDDCDCWKSSFLQRFNRSYWTNWIAIFQKYYITIFGNWWNSCGIDCNAILNFDATCCAIYTRS